MSAYYSSQNIGVGGGQQPPGNYSMPRVIRVGVQGNIGPTAAPGSQGLLPQNSNIQTNTNVTLGLVNAAADNLSLGVIGTAPHASLDQLVNAKMSTVLLNVNLHTDNVLQVAGPELGLPHDIVYQ